MPEVPLSFKSARVQTPSLFVAWLICGLAALFYCYEYLLRIQQSVMVPQLMHHFHATAKQIGYMSAMYYYTYTPLQLVVALLTDYYGSRRMLIFALLNCVVGCVVFGFSVHLYAADTGRILIGIGSAFAFVATLRLAAMWLPKKYFAVFIGLATSLGMVGAMVGDVGMSWVVEHYGWVSVIHAGAVVGILLIPLFFLFIREKPTEQLQSHKRMPVSYFLKGLLLTICTRQVLLLGFIGCALYLSLSVFADMWGIMFLQRLTHLTKVQAASLNIFVYFGWLVGGPLHGWFSDKILARRRQLLLGSLFALACFVLIIYGHVQNIALLSLLLFMFGFFSSVEILCYAMACERMPTELTATSLGVVNFIIMIGGLIVLPLIGSILDSHWSGSMEHGVRAYGLENFHSAFLLMLIIMVVAAVATFLLQSKDSMVPSEGT